MNDGSRLRCAVCDDDHLYTSLIEAMLVGLGHEVVGVATTAADGVALVEAARPDVVIVDLSMDYNSDFDVVASAIAVGATVVVFSQRADDAILSRYSIRPVVVYKPDIAALEVVIGRLRVVHLREVSEHERRERPTRAAAGPEPTSVADSQSFYGALNDAVAGDTLVSIDLPEHPGQAEEAADVAARVGALMRTTDRLLAATTSVRVLLPAGGDDAVTSLLARLSEGGALPRGATARTVTIAPEELPVDAFERLKTVPPTAWPHQLG